MNDSSTSIQSKAYRFSRRMWLLGSFMTILLLTPGLAISHPLFNVNWNSVSQSVPQTAHLKDVTLSESTHAVSPTMISQRYRDDAFYHLGHALARGFTYYFFHPRHHHHEAHAHHRYDSYEHHYAPPPSYFYGPYSYGPSYQYPAYPYSRHYYGRHHHIQRHHHAHGHHRHHH